ncbi:hypothetical protein Fmac_022825 [Flemingia macrophylla]|uniref:Patellin-3 n=1 Tax=Flemingia macrophylla TaxID=520843 RepID=A0ABD1M0S3_9FABA
MAEEPHNPTAAEQVLPVPGDNPPTTQAEAEAEAGEKPITTTKAEAEVEAEAEEKGGSIEETDKAHESVSFKEETNVVADLPEAQKKALEELKKHVQEALNKHELTAPKPPPEKKKPAQEPQKKEPEVVAEVVGVTEEKKEVTEVTEEKREVTEVTEEKKAVEVTEVTEEKKVVEVTEEKKEAKEKTDAQVTEEEAEKKEVQVTEKQEQVTVTEEKKEVQVTETEEKKEVEEEVTATVTEEKKEVEAAPPTPEEVEIWGIPLLADERSDVILLKFLRARDFKVKDALSMIRNTVRWRKEFRIDDLVAEDLGSEWDKVVFNHGYDKEGHSVCYNVFGEFENKELYNKTFSDEEKRNKFIRWRIQLLEKSVRGLDFSPTAISTIVQVNDLKNSPGLGKRDLRLATNQALQLLQDNYPEFVAKQIFINVPWWYLAFYRMISPFLTQRTKSKFVFAGPSKSAETLFKYISPELVPVQYGGLSREGEQEFSTADPVTEVTIKPAAKHAVVLPLSQKSHLVWEIRVVGWDVNYGAEFVPSAEDGYTVIVQKSRKIASTDETVITHAFKTGEPGEVVLTIDNQTSKKKKLLYRSKTKAIAD